MIGSPITHSEALTRLHALEAAVLSVFVGRLAAVRTLTMGLIAGLHVLIEDIPGVGKTTLAKSFADAAGMDFARIQFTPDLLPGDIVGMTIWDTHKQEFVFRAGPIMHAFVLADEINRASARTQAAFLEAMQEGAITVDGRTMRLPEPFFVVATQNPSTFAGTFPLPESQIDRIGLSMRLAYPTAEAEDVILTRFAATQRPPAAAPVLDPPTIGAIRTLVREVKVADRVRAYLLELGRRTRHDAAIRLGLSPRALQHWHFAVRAYALLEDRDYVIPEDVMALFEPVARHRLVLSPEARVENNSIEQALEGIRKSVPVPAGY